MHVIEVIENFTIKNDKALSSIIEEQGPQSFKKIE